MRHVSAEFEPYGQALAATLRAVRRHRRMRQTQIATALGISRRSYIDLEAGVGRLPIAQLIAFADATDSDRLALVAAILLDKPSLAVRCADNKLMTVMMIAADDFEAAIGERMAELRPQELISVFEGVFERLTADLSQRQAADARLAERMTRPSGGREDV